MATALTVASSSSRTKRARPRSPEVRGILAISDFVVVNRDYRAHGWKKMLAEYPPEEVSLVKRIDGYDDTIEVYRIRIPAQLPTEE